MMGYRVSLLLLSMSPRVAGCDPLSRGGRVPATGNANAELLGRACAIVPNTLGLGSVFRTTFLTLRLRITGSLLQALLGPGWQYC